MLERPYAVSEADARAFQPRSWDRVYAACPLPPLKNPGPHKQAPPPPGESIFGRLTAPQPPPRAEQLAQQQKTIQKIYDCYASQQAQEQRKAALEKVLSFEAKTQERGSKTTLSHGRDSPEVQSAELSKIIADPDSQPNRVLFSLTNSPAVGPGTLPSTSPSLARSALLAPLSQGKSLPTITRSASTLPRPPAAPVLARSISTQVGPPRPHASAQSVGQARPPFTDPRPTRTASTPEEPRSNLTYSPTNSSAANPFLTKPVNDLSQSAPARPITTQNTGMDPYGPSKPANDHSEAILTRKPSQGLESYLFTTTRQRSTFIVESKQPPAVKGTLNTVTLAELMTVKTKTSPSAPPHILVVYDTSNSKEGQLFLTCPQDNVSVLKCPPELSPIQLAFELRDVLCRFNSMLTSIVWVTESPSGLAEISSLLSHLLHKNTLAPNLPVVTTTLRDIEASISVATYACLVDLGGLVLHQSHIFSARHFHENSRLTIGKVTNGRVDFFFKTINHFNYSTIPTTLSHQDMASIQILTIPLSYKVDPKILQYYQGVILVCESAKNWDLTSYHAIKQQFSRPVCLSSRGGFRNDIFPHLTPAQGEIANNIFQQFDGFENLTVAQARIQLALMLATRPKQ